DRKLETCATLFGEAQSRIVISIAPADLEAVRSSLTSAQLPFSELGTVGGDALQIRLADQTHRWPIAEIHDLWFNAIARAVNSDASAS
ncbi:MAG: hypothetical protein M3Y86_02010, partial [Verrucomicrobiota bacterium]|nr:hypothetical protein [Verrucomicrobiota bacterium]